MASPDAVDALLRRVLAVTLDPANADAGASPPVVHLAGVAAESGATLLSDDLLDVAIVARLIESPPEAYPQPPLHYLLGCYERAQAAAGTLPAGDAGDALRGTLASARQQVVSYAGLVLSGSGVVPEPDAAAARGALQLLDAIDARDGTPPEAEAGAGVVALPHGFVADLAEAQDSDVLGAILEPVVKALARRAQACSPLGSYAAPLGAVRQLLAVEPAARALASLPSFLPDLAVATGRGIELPGSSWLGPLFSVSALPDPLIRALPDVRQQCFSGMLDGSRRQGDAANAVHALRLAGRAVTNDLAAITRALLGKATRPDELRWLAGVIEGNAERAKMQANAAAAASHGFFANLCAVLLRLCAPFVDGGSGGAFWQRADPRYVPLGGRLSFADDAKLAATRQEEAAWVAQQRAAGAAGPPEGRWHFICECFFMTAKALHLGLIKLVAVADAEGQQLAYKQQEVQEYERALASVGGTAAAASPQAMVLQAKLTQARRELDQLNGAVQCVHAVLGDPDLTGEVTAFYRLMAAWLLRLVLPNGDLSDPRLPLPEQVPMAWALLPEFFVEDAVIYLEFVTRYCPQLLPAGGAGLDGVMVFLVVLMASPGYVKNPYLRGRLGELLHLWLPHDAADGGGFRRARVSARDASMAPLFSAHPLVVAHLVPALLSLYTDVESTDQANAFYLKFRTRHCVGEILQYCWGLAPHREAWRRYAALDGGRGPYQRFANMVINDSIYLLDESLKLLKDTREKEARLAAQPPPPPQEQAELRHAVRGAAGTLRALLPFAGGTIGLLATSTAEVVAPLLLPEMVDRLAGMLNYFLLYLTGPKRRLLKVNDPEKVGFKPKELVAQICTVYLNVSAADAKGAFAAAVAADARSYRPDMFAEAALVLRQFGLLGEHEVQRLEALAAQVAQAAVEAGADEEAVGDAPDEFLDPITYTLMRDPVLLPTSGAVMDRPSIMRHLLTDQRDPINRQPLTPEQLRPADELRARIEAWLNEQRRRSGGGAAGGGGGGA